MSTSETSLTSLARQKNFLLTDANGVLSIVPVADVLQSALPNNIVMAWSGSASTIPDGWKLCDGTSNTPTLKGRFLFGLGDSDTLGGVGGSKSVVLKLTDIPNHYHSIRANNTGSDHGYIACNAGDCVTNIRMTDKQNNQAWVTSNVATYSADTVSLSNDENAKDSPDAVNTMPPYLSLNYIIKTSGVLPAGTKDKRFLLQDTSGVVSTESVSDVMSNLIPSGTIMVWWGNVTTIPEGWKLCNGSSYSINGTNTTSPDLRGKFVYGSPDDSVLGTGGSKTVTLTGNNTPNHYHTLRVSDAGWVDSGRESSAQNVMATDKTTNFLIRKNPDSYDGFVGKMWDTSAKNWVGTQTSVDILPPYMFVVYIIKVD